MKLIPTPTRSSEARARCLEAAKHPIIRFTVTHLNSDGMRTLCGGADVRSTYATREEAEAHLAAMLANNSQGTLRSLFGFPLEVRPVPCWKMDDGRPGDPMTRYFD